MLRDLFPCAPSGTQPTQSVRVGVTMLLLAVGLPLAAAPTNSASRPALWSLQPLTRPAVPPVPPNPDGAVARNPIDAFVLEKLRQRRVAPAPSADQATLIRRLYFDLTGLPPRPEDIEAFVHDTAPRAYERLVDRLLESPAYGERWARHWLDVVHFGETHGYDKDQPRPNAWPYRDYVIRAFNEDRPYWRFVQEQVAGDVLFPGTRDGIEGLGFVAAGPWDLIGHAEVPETKIDGRVARHLDRDDMVANTFQTFNSLTVQCAQCHNHKFDPIPQEDYYRLQSVFAAVDRADRRYDADPAVARRRVELTNSQATLNAQLRDITARIRRDAGPVLTNLDQRIAALEKAGKRGDAMGYHSVIEAKPDPVKWVQVDLGASVALSNVVLYPCHDNFNGIGDGFGFPVRYRVELAEDPEFRRGVSVLVDHTGADRPNPKLVPEVISVGGRSGRHLRVTATRLVLRQNDYIFALAELEAITPAGRNAALGARVTARDSIEAPPRWQKSNLTDGWYPGGSRQDAGELLASRAERDALLEKRTPPADRAAMAEIRQGLTNVTRELARLPAPSVAYVATVHHGSGAFVGTGSKGGRPRPIHVLSRGDVTKPGATVTPGALSCVPGPSPHFDLPPEHPEGARRAALARWLTDPANPLTWRSIVNRVWQYHFGRGLVLTPNDFGNMGAAPTHPELLDWLAVEFRDGGQSLKSLHRLIVNSATYRQSSRVEGDPNDPDNLYLARQNRRRLEAEAVHDAVLQVAGRLDRRMGGPSYRDFVLDKPEHSPHYEYHLHDPNDPKSQRRSVYRFIVRSQQQPFMTTLDCADPSMQVARRNESMSALQALALLNNSLVLAMSRQFAARMEKYDGDLSTRVERAYYEAIGRRPDPAQRKELTAYAAEFGLPNYCRVLFNLNEFLFVD